MREPRHSGAPSIHLYFIKLKTAISILFLHDIAYSFYQPFENQLDTNLQYDLYEDVLKIWLYTEGPQDVLAFVKKKTGQKFNWHTRHNCDICRTIFTDKSILPILRDNVFEFASMPLLFYHCKAKTENERRTKQ